MERTKTQMAVQIIIIHFRSLSMYSSPRKSVFNQAQLNFIQIQITARQQHIQDFSEQIEHYLTIVAVPKLTQLISKMIQQPVLRFKDTFAISRDYSPVLFQNLISCSKLLLQIELYSTNVTNSTSLAPLCYVRFLLLMRTNGFF